MDSDEGIPVYPVETLRHWYVTPYGGMSPELALFQIGINREAIELNTSLDPALDRVRVSVVGRARARPVLFDRFFEIVPLDTSHPNALARSPKGEAVFPEGDEVVRRYEPPRHGDAILLNCVLSQRLGLLPTAEEFAGILQELLRAASERDRRNS